MWWPLTKSSWRLEAEVEVACHFKDFCPSLKVFLLEDNVLVPDPTGRSWKQFASAEVSKSNNWSFLQTEGVADDSENGYKLSKSIQNDEERTLDLRQLFLELTWGNTCNFYEMAAKRLAPREDIRRNLPHGTRDDTLIQICKRPLMPTWPDLIPISASILLSRPTHDYLTTLMPLPLASWSKGSGSFVVS